MTVNKAIKGLEAAVKNLEAAGARASDEVQKQEAVKAHAETKRNAAQLELDRATKISSNIKKLIDVE